MFLGLVDCTRIEGLDWLRDSKVVNYCNFFGYLRIAGQPASWWRDPFAADRTPGREMQVLPNARYRDPSGLLAWMRGSDSGLRLPWRMFWVGLGVRVLYITLGHSYHFRTFQDHFQFGWEMGRIARAIATGRGYSEPFMTPSRPTAWCPPIYPPLLDGIFKVFGV